MRFTHLAEFSEYAKYQPFKFYLLIFVIACFPVTYALKQSCNWTICIDQPCDYLVMNSVNNLKKALMYLQRYLHIHCYLDNDLAGQKTVETIAGLYGERVSNEAVRYSEYKDLNDCLRGKKR